MDSILRGLAVYLFLLMVFRFAGKRTLAQMTSFDLVLLLIISETTQEAMIDDDHSFTNAALLILTLVGTSIVLSWLKQLFPRLDKWLDDVPLILVDHGRLLEDRLRRSRVSKEDILMAARQLQGLERLDQIKFAVLEANGEITVIPRS